MAVTPSDIIALLALLLSTYATWQTIKSNKRQESLVEGQERLNALLLKKELGESVAAGQADLGASFVRLGGGSCRLKVFNKGKVPARNVEIEFPEGNEIIIKSEIRDKFPLEVLDTHQSVELVAAVSMGSPRKLPIRLKWSDEQNSSNEKTLYPTL